MVLNVGLDVSFDKMLGRNRIREKEEEVNNTKSLYKGMMRLAVEFWTGVKLVLLGWSSHDVSDELVT
jgi:hypothetical protein